MPCIVNPADIKIKRLLIECPTSITDQYDPAPPTEWFEIVGGNRYLQLWVTPDKYERTLDRSNTDAYRDTLTGQFAPVQTARVGFEAEINEKSMDTLYLVEHVVSASLSADYTQHTPITILDFVRPERTDRIAAGPNDFYTVRQGRIFDVKETGGFIGKRPKVFTQGFRISFKERERRRILG